MGEAKRKRPQPLLDTIRAMKSKLPPRLTGDALYLWGQRVIMFEQAKQQHNEAASLLLQEAGYEPGKYLLTDDGYIMTPAAFQAAQTAKQSLVPDGNRPEPVPTPGSEN